VYDNTGVPYGNGTFEVIIEPEVSASSIVVTRNLAGGAQGYITLCEVEVFAGNGFASTCLSLALEKM